MGVKPFGHLWKKGVGDGSEDVVSFGIGDSDPLQTELYFRPTKPYGGVDAGEGGEPEIGHQGSGGRISRSLALVGVRHAEEGVEGEDSDSGVTTVPDGVVWAEI